MLPLRSVFLGVLIPAALSGSIAAAKAPVLTALEPAGAQRGQTVEVKAIGSFDPWPVQAYVQGEGLVVEPGVEAGTLRVTVAPDAPIDRAWIRLFNTEGASAPRPFLVGRIPEMVETEPNDDPAEATSVESRPVTINGRLEKRGDVDGYAVTLDAGQTLVAAMEAHERLGSPMDATLQIATPDGFVLDEVDDDRGLDPRLVFVAPRSGTYVVRAFAFPASPDSSIRFASGETYVYRLTLTTEGFADYAYPLAVSRVEPTPVRVEGWNLPDDLGPLPVACREDVEPVARLAHPALANTVDVSLEPHPSLVESDSENEPPSDPLVAPVTVSGRIDPMGDRDAYPFETTKDSSLFFRVHSRTLGFPLDPILRIRDAAGKIVAEEDDTGRDSRDVELVFKAPEDGSYHVEIADLNRRGGPRYVYRLDVLAPPEPDVLLSVKSDRFTLEAGKPLEIEVQTEPRRGFTGNVELTMDVDGLPCAVMIESATVKVEGRKAQTGKLTLSAVADQALPAWSGPFRVLGRLADVSDQPTRIASFALEGIEATNDRGWLTVIQAEANAPEPDTPSEPEAK